MSERTSLAFPPASTVKTGVLEVLNILTEVESMKEIIISGEGYMKAIYFDLLKVTD